jgi:hypothetical protein
MVSADNNGGAIVIWNDSRNFNYDIYMQKLNSAGVVQLNADGVVICDATRDQSSPEIISDGSGGAIVTWDDKRVNNDSTDVYAQRISSAGTAMWVANGIAVSKAKHKQIYPSIAPLGNNGAVITWFDNRSAADATVFCNDVYIQTVKNDGTLGDPNGVTAIRPVAEIFSTVKAWPNPLQDELFIQNGNRQLLHFQLLDVDGRLLMQGIAQPGSINQVSVKKLATGSYVLKIFNQKGESGSVKLVKQ